MQAPPAVGGSLRVEPLAEVPFTGSIGSVKLWDRYLSYTPDHASIVVCDLDQGLVTTLDRFDRDEGASVALATGSGDVVVALRWSVQRHGEGDEADGDWTVESVELTSGRRRTVAQGRVALGGETGEESVRPQARVTWPWAVWIEPRGPTSDEGRIVAADVRTGRRRVLVERARAPRDVGVSGATVVFDGPGGGEGAGRDLFAVPVEGGAAPRRLTADGGIRSFVVSHGHVVWDVPGDGPAHRDLWAQSLDEEATPVHLGRAQHGVPGNGFVLADDLGWLVLHDLGRPEAAPVDITDRRTKDQRDRETQWDASGDLIVWATHDYQAGRGSKHLHVARVLRSAS